MYYVIAGSNKKYEKRLILYKKFGENICEEGFLTFDDLAKDQIYIWETYGRKKYFEIYGNEQIDFYNGYHHGKRMLNITISAWIEDIKLGLLSLNELEEDYQNEIKGKI